MLCVVFVVQMPDLGVSLSTAWYCSRGPIYIILFWLRSQGRGHPRKLSVDTQLRDSGRVLASCLWSPEALLVTGGWSSVQQAEPSLDHDAEDAEYEPL